MNAKIQVPHPIEVLYGRGVALACGLNGEVTADKLHGLFAGDTRVLSTYSIAVDGVPWKLLSRERRDSSNCVWSFQNTSLRSAGSGAAEGMLLLRLSRRVSGALHDELWLCSFLDKPLKLRLTVRLDADFADIFQVKEQSIPPRLTILRAAAPQSLLLAYEHGAFRRGLDIHWRCSSGRPVSAGSMLVFELALPARGRWNCTLDAIPLIDGEAQESPYIAESAPAGPPGEAGIAVDCAAPLASVFRRGQADLHSLAVPQEAAPPYLAAGVPWFYTLFGRDSLIASLMAGLDGSWPAEGALFALGERQADSRDDWRDAEPGKIPHELRRGELAHKNIIPHSAYYGTHDAQSLYCLALWQAWRWTGKQSLLDAHFNTASAALNWCETFGDRDGDGFQEYARLNPQGYYNQGWKDAHDAILHADGRLAGLPLATVELQGDLFAARLAMAELYEARDMAARAEALRQSARELQQKVEERYWMEDEDCYALALDGSKRLVKTISSNPGHLLWCGLPCPERAARLAARLLQSDMFSGWGLRTMSARHPAYNPLSYQLGSVWPFDTVLAAAGMWRYGFHKQAGVLLGAILEAAAAFEQDRLPELFCGIDRALGPPIPYEKANIPQAWSAAVPVTAVMLFLGLLPDAPRKRCYLSPHLPEWLPYLEVNGIVIGEGRLDIRISRQGSTTAVDSIRADGIEVLRGSQEAPLWGLPLL